MALDRPIEFVRDRPTDVLHDPDPRRPYAHYIAAMNEALRRRIEALDIRSGARVVDFGCAEQPYRSWFPTGAEVVGADLPGNPAADLVVDSDGRLPVEDGTFDVVVSTQVLEHVVDPAAYLAECRRVLAAGGQLLLSTHGQFFFHPDPVDYWRWTCAGLRKTVNDAGFEITEFEGVVGHGAMGLQMTFDTILPRVPTRLRPLACRAANALIAAVDRRQSADSKRLNASVFVLTGRPVAAERATDG